MLKDLILIPHRHFARISHVAWKKAPEDEGVPEHIKRYKKLSKKAKQMVATTNRHHRQAFDAAVEEVLMPEGQVDMDLLDKPENQEKFAEKMSDFYISKARGVFKIGEKEKFDDLERELLMNAYAGTTKAKLLGYVRTLGKDFTFETFYNHEEFRPEMMKSIQENLGAATISHLKDKHIGDIVKHTKSGDFVDKDKVTLRDAIRLLGEYETEGAVLEKKHKKALYYKGKKAD